MSARSSGAGSGVVLGLVGVLLGQQFAYLSFADPVTALIELVVAAVVGGILCAVIGSRLGRKYRTPPPETKTARVA